MHQYIHYAWAKSIVQNHVIGLKLISGQAVKKVRDVGLEMTGRNQADRVEAKRVRPQWRNHLCFSRLLSAR